MTRFVLIYLVGLATVVAVTMSMFSPPSNKTMPLGSDFILPIGGIVILEYNETDTFPVLTFGGLKPLDCSVKVRKRMNYTTSRLNIEASALVCSEYSIPLEGYGMGLDTSLGLRVDPQNSDLLDEDKQFSLIVTNGVSLGLISFDYTE
ncbi:hypothetical protein J4N45_10175 [Vibrio sp. SCSIO 43140]|uniref:hypothetical protein n=1 Tax=Vibrio sp. SCSIO 43140 TaxID=2819100 RepID=UPI002074B56D|nr:hypothetical protein [Vibrio sp. SCSIO 43140]USD58896.1 hypothetical protein J4N45_10175 [Vibrio sp. SCSIO 43140]